MTRFIIPTAKSLEKSLAMLFGRDVKVTACNDAGSQKRHVATFLADDNSLVALCVCDSQFVGYSGAALTMVPSGVANEMVATNDFNAMVLDSFHEIMNICSSLLMSESSPHLRLGNTLPPSESEAALAGLGSGAEVAAFEVGFPRYGSGRLTFLVS